MLQLAKCSASSDALINDMRRTFKTRIDPAEILLKVSTRYLLVGKCDNRFAGLAKFLPTKVVYAFEHPTHRQVEMHMAYKDMIGVRTQPATAPGAAGELRFRIGPHSRILRVSTITQIRVMTCGSALRQPPILQASWEGIRRHPRSRTRSIIMCRQLAKQFRTSPSLRCV